jgi:hypothetical protein
LGTEPDRGGYGPDGEPERQNLGRSGTAARSAFSAHKATGYEINFRCLKTAKAYSEIVRWDGPLGRFTYLKHADGAQYGVANGDVVKATIVGNVITAYVHGVQTIQATDNTFSGGAPGIGLYIQAPPA